MKKFKFPLYEYKLLQPLNSLDGEISEKTFRHRTSRPLVKIITLAIMMMFSSFSIALASTYYVDKDASGRDNGSSWGDAWTGFSKINWNAIGPGDTILISGGQTSKTYYETISVDKSGVENAPITIQGAGVPGHNGKVILDGQNSSFELIGISGKQYVTISDFTLKSTSDTGRAVDLDESSRILVKNCDISIAGRAGIFVEESSHCVIQNNTMATLGYVPKQTDGIYSQRNEGNVYDGNTIIIRNSDEGGHNDGIQSYMDESMIFRNNYVEQDNQKQINSQGIYCTTLSGTFQAYNNIIYAPNTYNSCIAFKIPNSSYNAIVYNNTIIGGKWGSIKVEDANKAVIRNNILWDYNDGVALTYNAASEQVSHNLSDRNPLLDDNFVPTAGSPAIDQGADLDAPYNVDKVGTIRPAGSGFDIGAMERRTEEKPVLMPPQKLRVIH